MNDYFIKPKGVLEIYTVDKLGNTKLAFKSRNAITFRAKSILSRILGGGLGGAADPQNISNSDFKWGSPNPETLRVTGIALGNGGHLIYDSTTKSTSSLPKTSGTLVLDENNISSNISLPAMPYISGNDWGYNSTPNQTEPGPSYQHVENGNVPWDGTNSIFDNSVGVTQPNTTLYSETYRIPLDSDGIKFITETEVQFKATLPQSVLNHTGNWGFANQPANYISEVGLITGKIPAPNEQIYSTDGSEPSGNNFDPNLPAKDIGTKPPDSVNPDSWSGGNENYWNMIARKTSPAIVKSSSFSLVFVWTIGF